MPSTLIKTRHRDFMVRRTHAIFPVGSFLLDNIASASRAYSVRKLRAAYAGPAMRVRRSSDNAEQDFGFSGGDLDTSAIGTFVGLGGSQMGHVVTMYDQSGNGVDATQGSAGGQPWIVHTGAIVNVGGIPTMYTDGNRRMGASSSALVKEATAIATQQSASSFEVNASLMGFSGGLFVGDDGTTSFQTGLTFGSNISVNNGGNTCLFNFAIFQVRGNSSTGASGTLNLFWDTVNFNWTGHGSEFITWSSELSSGDRTTLYDDQKDYYGLP